MTAREADQPGPRPVHLEVTGAPVRLGDVIESGADRPPGRPPRIAAGFALVLIVVAAMAGYLFGSRHPATTSTPPAPTTPPVALPLAATGKQCSVQLKDRLQLGIEIINQSPTALTLGQVQAVLPLNGLRATATTWGSCGQLPLAAGGDDHSLAAGATTWLTITFGVLVSCPEPLPVQFAVHWTQASRSGTADLPGFADLGDVPYTRCPSGSS